MFKRLSGLVVAVLLIASPAFAATKTFTAALSGKVETSNTGSSATGTAKIVIDTDKHTVDIAIDVAGLKIADLWDKLREAPVGPIHLHNYLANGDVVLVLPAPFGSGYSDTPKGFTVSIKGYDYAAGAKTLKSDLSFDGFMAAMASGTVVLNVHTNKFSDGEISGKVVAAS